MDHRIAADSLSNAYYHLHNHHIQQQQQQQQQQQTHHAHQAQQQQQQNPYQQSLDHADTRTSAQNSLAFTSYYALPSSTASALASNVASSSQPWSRNPDSMLTAGNLTAQQAYYSVPETHHHSDSYAGSSATDHSRHHGWVLDGQRSQWTQHSSDNCLPPGIESTASYPSVQYPHPYQHPEQLQYAYSQQALNPWAATTPSVWPSKKQTKTIEKKIPLVKTTTMKNTSAAPGGLGWCALCQRDCITESALKQHLEGKPHKRQVERQRACVEAATKTAAAAGMDTTGQGVATVLEHMWAQVSTMGKPSKGKKSGNAGAGPANGVGPMYSANSDANPKNANGEKVLEMFRCELCNVGCNSPEVLQIHFGGKKHAYRVSKAGLGYAVAQCPV